MYDYVAIPPVPSDLGATLVAHFERLDALAQYLYVRTYEHSRSQVPLERLSGSVPKRSAWLFLPKGTPSRTIFSLGQAAKHLANAYANPCTSQVNFPSPSLNFGAVKMEFDAAQLDRHLGINPTGRNDTTEASVGLVAPEAQEPGRRRDACVYLDRHNRLLLWYLPDFLDMDMRVSTSGPPPID